MNILVPIDFSPASLRAFHYACETAGLLKAKVFLLHIISSRKEYETEKEKLESFQKIAQKMTRLSRIYPHQQVAVRYAGFSIVHLIQIGTMKEVLSRICNTKEIDLIMLGVRDKHTILDYLLGSVSTMLIKLAPCPLILIPEKTRTNTVERIAIASDEEKISEELWRFTNGLAKQLKAKLEQVYVYPLPKDFSDQKEECYNSSCLNEQPALATIRTVVRDPFVIRGLDYFIRTHQIDLLTLYVPERKGFQKIFHRSISKQMAYHSHTPLLIWNEKTNTNYEILD